VFGVAPAIVQWAHYVAYRRLGQNASLTLNNNNMFKNERERKNVRCQNDACIPIGLARTPNTAQPMKMQSFIHVYLHGSKMEKTH